MQQSEPLVSVVISNHNYGHFLGAAIDSALGQTHPNTEIIVIDDGSTDDSRVVIAGYGDRIHAAFQENQGQGAAYNAGFALCRGAVVIFLDSDDKILPDAASRVITAMTASVVKVQYYLAVIDADGQELARMLPVPSFSTADPLDHLRLYGYYSAPPGSGAAYSRSYLDQIMPMPAEDFRYGADGYTSVLAPLFGRIASIGEPLAHYRFHDSNVSEVSHIDVAKLRRLLTIDVNREAALQHFAKQRDLPLRPDRMRNIPGHVKYRLLSLRLDPPHHPFPDDTVWQLILSGLVAVQRFPHTTWRKKLVSSLGFLVLPLMPLPLLNRLLAQATANYHRRGLLRIVTS